MENLKFRFADDCLWSRLAEKFHLMVYFSDELMAILFIFISEGVTFATTILNKTSKTIDSSDKRSSSANVGHFVFIESVPCISLLTHICGISVSDSGPLVYPYAYPQSWMMPYLTKEFNQFHQSSLPSCFRVKIVPFRELSKRNELYNITLMWIWQILCTRQHHRPSHKDGREP